MLLMACAAFFIYEFVTYRNISKNELTTLSKIVASNSTASLAFENKEDAQEILNALKAQKHLVGAALYDKNGKLFSSYPDTFSIKKLTDFAPANGYEFKRNYIEVFEPVAEGSNSLGTLYLKSDMKEVYHRFMLYGIIAISFFLLSLLFAYLISKRLQKVISGPILELAAKAKMVSDHSDYTVRAIKRSEDELGSLTDAFNHMLTQIESQNAEIIALNQNLEQKVSKRTVELESANSILKQQNDFIQTIIDSSVDLIAVFDKNMHYLILNRQADKIYHQKREAIIGNHILAVFPELQGTVMIENLNRALAGEFIKHDVYESVITGHIFENFFIPLTDKNNEVDRVLVIGHDITKIMEANQQLKLVNIEIEKSNRNLEQFAYIASHDLQEPLRKIKMFSELCEENILDPDTLKQFLAKINFSANRMSDLITAVLNYSRLSEHDHAKEEIDLNDILVNAKTDLELLIADKNAVINNDVLPVIKGFPLQMNQLFFNLIGNAMKFSDKPPAITITSEICNYNDISKNLSLKNAGNYAVLKFIDNGIGFEEQFATKIFSIFQRLHGGKKYAGTGIGLALCKKITENHGGTITAKSRPGQGSTFIIYLPLDR
jgi:PAS domain S-box-containing protein